ncbi:hypothetical protein Murru_3218 [Allomuricauda ruestringensis DSM 13258]|uniref:Uncharacterized protein n=1 Tax=Allomuricauda ruestringensis (strain DSM 13258 / CIP 107369 / LMG 19739 / B1) TaxID=886377 RepID=G2PLW8_ALLRU|nr:hypothetical protein Murru_3218 [Allomuricauda ruestringensis DSM 13258]
MFSFLLIDWFIFEFRNSHFCNDDLVSVAERRSLKEAEMSRCDKRHWIPCQARDDTCKSMGDFPSLRSLEMTQWAKVSPCLRFFQVNLVIFEPPNGRLKNLVTLNWFRGLTTCVILSETKNLFIGKKFGHTCPLYAWDLRKGILQSLCSIRMTLAAFNHNSIKIHYGSN